MKVKYLIIAAMTLLIPMVVYIAYRYNYIPHEMYEDEAFGIVMSKSTNDEDNDGIDDYSDMLVSAREYLATNPKYKSKYYAQTGYSNDEYGVCTDVIAFAMQGTGYDLMLLVNEDIRNDANDYDIEQPDIYIDFRRVKNLKVFFSHTATSLTTDISKIEEWQAGDIVIWNNHIGLISDKRNKEGIPFVLHNANPIQASYEEDILPIWGKIVGHYRLEE